MKSLSASCRYTLALLLTLGLAACVPGAATVAPLPVTPTPTARPTATIAPTTTGAPTRSPAPTAPAPTATATAAPTVSATPSATATSAPSQGGSTTRPAALRRLATWGDGVPVDLALSPDSSALYVATALRLRRHDAGELASIGWDEPLDDPPTAIALSPDGSTLAVALGKRVELRATADGSLVAALRHDTPVNDVAFAPDSALLAVALEGEAVAVWDSAERTTVRELRMSASDPLFFPGPVTSVAFAPDGRQIAAGDFNGNVTTWSVESGEMLVSADIGPRTVADVSYAPDGSTLAAASEGWRSEAGAIWMFDPASGAQLDRLTVDTDTRLLEPVERVLFASDGASVIAGTATGAILRWAWPSGELLAETTAHRAGVRALALAAGGGLISAGRDGDLRRWNADGANIDELKGLAAISAVAAGGATLASGGEDGAVTLWEPGGANRLHFVAHKGHVNALAVSPDGATLASAGDDGAVRLWASADGAARGVLLGHAGPVLALAFAPDGATLASAGWDGTIRLWALPAGELARTITVIESDGLSATAVLGVTFDAEGETVAGTAYDGAIRRYALDDDRQLSSLETGAGGWLIAVASARGYTTALDDSGILWAWSASGQPVGREALADATALLALGRGRLLTVGPAGGLRLWSLDGDGPIELAAAASVGDRLAVSEGGEHAIVGSRRGFIELWALP